MKFLKVLIVPAVIVVSVMIAVPALAHAVTNVSVTSKCVATGQICIHLSGTIPEQGNEKRTIRFDLFGVNGSTVSDRLGEVTFDLPASTGTEQTINVPDQCFTVVTGAYDHFLVKYEGTVSGDIQLSKTVKDTAGNNQQVRIGAGDTVADNIPPCVAPTSTATQTATPTATPAAAALASTGGFDFRFPLVGLTVIVAGLALLLVSLSRGRSPSK